MSENANNDVSDLFGEQLAGSEQPAQPAAFQDGIYVITGVGMKKGIYKSGKFVGKPYARFIYELEDGPTKRQVSQMLPWFPGKAFFEINFQQLCGMRLSEFTEHCRRENLNDPKSQSRFFLTLFRGVQYRAEIKQRGDWLNVWGLKERLGHPDEAIASAPEQLPESPAQPVDLGSKIAALAGKLSLADSDLESLCQEEFGIAMSQLGEDGQHTLIELLEEKIRLSDSTPF